MARESLGTKLKKGIYGAVSVVDGELDKVAKNVKKRKGAIGRTVGGVEGAIKDVKDGVGDVIDEVKKQVGPMHEEIKAGGGYAAAAKRMGKSVVDSVKGAYASLEKSVEDAFCKDGKLDPEKVKKVLENKGNAVKQYGPRAYSYLSKLAARGAEALSKDYHQFIPIKEDLETKYAGIGEKYHGILFKEHYDKCLAFHNKAKKKIPRGAKHRREILQDIKDSASYNKTGLKKFYAWQVTQDQGGLHVPDKTKTLSKYL